MCCPCRSPCLRAVVFQMQTLAHTTADVVFLIAWAARDAMRWGHLPATHHPGVISKELFPMGRFICFLRATQVLVPSSHSQCATSRTYAMRHCLLMGKTRFSSLLIASSLPSFLGARTPQEPALVHMHTANRPCTVERTCAATALPASLPLHSLQSTKPYLNRWHLLILHPASATCSVTALLDLPVHATAH